MSANLLSHRICPSFRTTNMRLSRFTNETPTPSIYPNHLMLSTSLPFLVSFTLVTEHARRLTEEFEKVKDIFLQRYKEGHEHWNGPWTINFRRTRIRRGDPRPRAPGGLMPLMLLSIVQLLQTNRFYMLIYLVK
jgi:hypothetical protein